MRTMQPMLARFAAFAAVFSLCGCAVTTADGTRLNPGSDGFADYVETVFRRQNAAATELTLALEDEDPASARYVALEAAELELLTACRGLNQLAATRRDGDDPRGLAALRRARQAPDCERALERVDALL